MGRRALLLFPFLNWVIYHPYMWAWYMCIKLAGTVKASFGIMFYHYNASMIEQHNFVTMYLMVW